MKNFWIIFLISILGSSLLIIARLFLVVVVVRGLSMVPALRHGDRVLVLRHWPACLLRIGQLVVGRIPADKESTMTKILQTQQLYIKRIIGLPGDVVRLNNTLVNKEKSSKAPIKRNNSVPQTWHIPQGFCFVKGDADTSTDSVVWGPIPFHSLIGVVLIKLPRPANIPPLHYCPDHSQDLFDTQVVEAKMQE